MVAAGDQPAVGGDRDGVDRRGVAVQEAASAGDRVPQPQPAVPAARGDERAVRRDRHRRDRHRRDLALMTLPARDRPARREIPVADRPVIACRNRVPPVGKDRDRRDRRVVAVQPPRLARSGEVPQHQGVIEAGRQHPRAIRRHRDPGHRAAMTLQRGHDRDGGHRYQSQHHRGGNRARRRRHVSGRETSPAGSSCRHHRRAAGGRARRAGRSPNSPGGTAARVRRYRGRPSGSSP
jgi:hypothetical protein